MKQTVSLKVKGEEGRLYTNVTSVSTDGPYLAITIDPPVGEQIIHHTPHTKVDYYSLKVQ